MQLCNLVNMIDKPFTNKLNQRIEIKSVFEVYGEIYVTYADSGGVKLASYNKYTESIFSEKPEEEYFRLGDEIDDNVYLVAIELEQERTIFCMAVCTWGRINRYADARHLKYVHGKGVPKSEIKKIYK